MEITGIYIVKNKITKKIYVGQTRDFGQRVRQHKNRLRREKCKTYNKLYPAVKKYGISTFEFIFIEACSISQLNEREIYWIKQYRSFKNGYNATPGGHASISYWKGKKRDIATRKKISKSLTGKRATVAHRKKISEGIKRNYRLFGTKRNLPTKKVICIELNKVFNSMQEGAQFIGRHPSAISKVIHGVKKRTGGYHWKLYKKGGEDGKARNSRKSNSVKR